MMEKKTIIKRLVLLTSLILTLVLASSSAYAALSCDSGTVNTICTISTSQTYDDAETFSGTGDLILSGSGVIENTGERQSLALDFSTVTLQDGRYMRGGNITITADNITIFDNAYISGNTYGYAQQTGPGAGGDVQWGGGGAGHGSLGGRGYYIAYTGAMGQPYGSSLNPKEYGSGGGRSTGSGSSIGGSGGGIIRLLVANTLDLNGSLTVNGGASAYRAGGGSGGSIYITTSTLEGNGSLSAIGSNGHYNNPVQGGGGSGGRIAVYYNESTFTGIPRSSVAGGAATSLYDDGVPGTMIFIDDDDKSATISSGFRFHDNLGIENETKNNSFYNTSNPNLWSFRNITIINATIFQADNLTLIYQNIILINTTWTCNWGNFNDERSFADSKVRLNISGPNLSIDSDTSFNFDGCGYPAYAGPSVGVNVQYGPGGAGHGGSSGRGFYQYYKGTNAQPHGSSLNPGDFGSGGGRSTGYAQSIGSKGGGVVRFLISDTLTFDGTINVNGWSATYSASGGAGGSVYINTTNLNGAGTISANGGSNTGGSVSVAGGGASGGRIAVYYNESAYTGLSGSSVSGGSGRLSAEDGDSGTLLLIDQDDDIVDVKGGFLTVDTDKNITFFDTSKPNIWNFTNVNLTIYELHENLLNPAWFYFGASFNISDSTWTSDEQLISLNITAVNLTLDSDSLIELSGRGYDSSVGTGTGGDITWGGGGAGHGGKGGRGYYGGFTGTAGTIYGSDLFPITFGSGGGRSTSSANSIGGEGGGAVKIDVQDTFNLSGTINVKGMRGPYNDYASYRDGGGSGGSVYIRTEVLTGDGAIDARGGVGEYVSPVWGGGGAGGRIAIYTNSSSFAGWPNVTVQGGAAESNGWDGDTGTFMLLESIQPTINLIGQSPDNNSGTTGSFELNITIDEHNLYETIYEWDGSNTTLYSDDLLLMFNFDNISEVGDRTGKATDVSIYNNSGYLGRNYTIIDEFLYESNWTYSEMSGPVTKPGLLLGSITQVDNPYMYKDITNFDESYDHIEIRYKSYTNGPAAIKLFYTDNTDCSSFSDTCSQVITITSDGNWYILDTQITDADWTDNDGTIDDIELAFQSASSTGYIEIDYIKFYSESSTIPTYVTGVHGKALSFDGTDDFVEVQDLINYQKNSRDVTLEMSPDASILFWVKRNSGSHNQIISRYNPSESDYIWQVSLSDTLLEAYFDSTATGYDSFYEINATVPSTDGAWHHVAVTKNNGVCKLFLDGNITQTKFDCPNSIDTSRSQPLWIGKGQNDTGTEYFNGSIDEVMILNKSLSDEEVLILYNSNLNKYNKNNWSFYINQTGIAIGSTYNYSLYVTDLATYSVDIGRRTIMGNTAPKHISISHNPSANISVDPSSIIVITANISDADYNLDTVWVEWINSTQTWSGAQTITMDNQTTHNGSTTWVLFTTNLTLPSYEDNISYRVVANDTSNETNISTNYILYSYYDSRPVTTSIDSSPSDWDDLDPGTLVTINATISDPEQILNTTILQWKLSNQTWAEATNTSMTNLTPTNTTMIMTTSIIPTQDSNYTIRIWTNDSTSTSNTSTEQTLRILWDCTWYATPTFLGSYFGWDETKNATSITIVNTGDQLYSANNCSLKFLLMHNLDWKRAYFDGDQTNIKLMQDYLDAGDNKTVVLNFTFQDFYERIDINITLQDADEYSENLSDKVSAILTSVNSPYLEQATLDPASTRTISQSGSTWILDLTPQTLLLNASLRNGVGDGTLNNTAFNVTFNWTTPELFQIATSTSIPYAEGSATVASATVSLFYLNISDGEREEYHYHFIKLAFNSTNLPSLENTTYYVNLSSKGYNPNGSIIEFDNTSINFNQLAFQFNCYETSDSICVESCRSPDPDCWVCGNGINDTNETCDNSSNNGVLCTAAYGETCNYCSSSCEKATVTGEYCGDGIIQDLEACDDNDQNNNDGCSSNCTVESGYSCTGEPSVCTSTIVLEEETPQNPGGGGGGGGGSSFGQTEAPTTTTFQRAALFQTSAEYELVRGEQQSFILTVENTFDGPMENVEVSLLGFLAQYLRLEPQGMFKIPLNGSINFTIFIEAPDYFTYGEYNLTFTIDALINKTKTFGNNTVYKYAPIQETRSITLFIQEISGEEANNLTEQASLLLEQMKAAGFVTEKIESLYSQLANLISSHDYSKVKGIFTEIKKQKETAFTASATLDEVNSQVAQAHERGLTTSETERLLLLAQSALDRGDFTLALERANDAKVTLTLETLGRFNLAYFLKRYWESLTVLAVFLSVFMYISFLSFRYFFIKKMIQYMRKEKKILFGLIEEVQFECFQQNKISMKEYKEAMGQYEKRLNHITQKVVELENKKINNFRIFMGETKKLIMEKDHILVLMKEIQGSYMRDGKIDTRSYDNKMHTYQKRLAEIEENLINIQTSRAIKRTNRHTFGLKFPFLKEKQAESAFFPKMSSENKKRGKK